MLDAFGDYYNDLANGNTNRAEEFLYNLGDGDTGVGLSIVYNEIQTNQQCIENTTSDTQPSQDVAYNFLYSLATSSNDYIIMGE